MLQVLTHRLGDETQANTREKVDGEPRVARVVQGEHVLKVPLHRRLAETRSQCRKAQ